MVLKFHEKFSLDLVYFQLLVLSNILLGKSESVWPQYRLLSAGSDSGSQKTPNSGQVALIGPESEVRAHLIAK